MTTTGAVMSSGKNLPVHHHDDQPREEVLWRAHGQGIIPGLPGAVVRFIARGSEGEVDIGGGSPHVRREKVDGVMQVAVKNPHRAHHRH